MVGVPPTRVDPLLISGATVVLVDPTRAVPPGLNAVFGVRVDGAAGARGPERRLGGFFVVEPPTDPVSPMPKPDPAMVEGAALPPVPRLFSPRA